METDRADHVAMDRIDGHRVKARGLDRRPGDQDGIIEAGDGRRLRSAER